MGSNDNGRPVIDLYARLSYSLTGDTVNVDDQIEMGVEDIEARGGRLGKVFKDNSLSAWNSKVVRPDWNVLMGRLESGHSDGVWVYDVTRFSRKVMEGERLVEAASRNIKVWSHAGSYDLTTADGRRHFREAMVAAAAESDKISERVRRGNLRRARKGRFQGGGRAFGMPGNERPPAGWEPGDPRTPAPAEQVEAERAIIRECYQRILAGEGISTLARELTARGISGVTGRSFYRSSLARTLRRPAVAGLLEYDGAIVGQLVGIEPIVTVEEWQRLCALLDARKHGRPAGSVHMLSGLLFCSGCGGALRGGPRPHQPPYPDGSVRREYRCMRNADRPEACGKIHIEALNAEQYVDEAMRVRLADPRRAARMAEHLSKVSEERAGKEAEIARLNAQADELALKTAKWGPDRVDKAMGPLLDRISVLQAELASLDTPDRAQASADNAVTAWTRAWDERDHVTLRAMIRQTFPYLRVGAQTGFNDHGPHRMIWEPVKAGRTTARHTSRPVAMTASTKVTKSAKLGKAVAEAAKTTGKTVAKATKKTGGTRAVR